MVRPATADALTRREVLMRNFFIFCPFLLMDNRMKMLLKRLAFSVALIYLLFPMVSGPAGRSVAYWGTATVLWTGYCHPPIGGGKRARRDIPGQMPIKWSKI